MVGNKVDLYDNSNAREIEISFAEGQRFAKKINAENFFEVSAKSGEGVSSLFEELAISLHNEGKKKDDDSSISLHKRRRNTADYYDDLNETGEVDPEKINYTLYPNGKYFWCCNT